MPDYTIPVFDNGTVLVNGVPTTDWRLAFANGSTIQFQPNSLVDMVITDNDGFLSNDNNVNEQADDLTQQTTNILGPTEKVYVDFAYTVRAPDGSTYILYVIDVGNSPDQTLANNRAVTFIGFQGSNPPPIGVPLTIIGFNGTLTVPYSTIACFTRGTFIATPTGNVPVESLRPGDPVLTRRGPQILRWMGWRHVSPFDLRRRPDLRPVIVRAGALGSGCPNVDTAVSPQHRIEVGGAMLEVLFGHQVALAPAKGLMDGIAVLPAPADCGVDYFHLLFDRHEIVQANGMWSESLLLARGSTAAIAEYEADAIDGQSAPANILHSFPAAPILRPYEARLWRRALVRQSGPRPLRAA
jgi:hypothetical protein